MITWQPIETAPKDNSIEMFAFDPKESVVRSTIWNRKEHRWSGGGYDWDPDYWMPTDHAITVLRAYGFSMESMDDFDVAEKFLASLPTREKPKTSPIIPAYTAIQHLERYGGSEISR